MKYGIAILILLVVVAAAALLPTRPYLDFQVLFHADLGLRRGISLYDHTGQVEMVAGLAHVPAGTVFVLPFPYPPWYALSTIWLALLPIDLAARAWFAVSLALLILSVALLTRGLPAPRRMAIFLACLLWAPALGGLFVGQYGFPVLLGAALMTYALEGEKPILVGIAAALLTFKPHLGGLLIVFVMARLIQQHDAFARRALASLALVGAILFAVGFLASSNWPVDYLRSLTSFKDVSRCQQCVSPAMAAAGLAGGGFDMAVRIAGVLAVMMAAWAAVRWASISRTAGNLVAAAVLITMLVSPYLQNYDYLLLLVPFIHVALTRKETLVRLGLGLALVLPLIALALLGTAGNAVLIISTCLLFIMEVWHPDNAEASRQAAA